MSRRSPNTARLTMAQAIVKFLQVQFSERDGVEQRLIPAVFGIFGHGNVCGMGQALEERGVELPYYQPCNEQSMVHTAAAFAKTTRRRQTFACLASIGPGSTNMVTGAALATINRLPVLLFPSDAFATRHQGHVLQQLEHPISADVSVNDSFRPVSRFFDRISRPEQLLTALPEAMRVLTDPAATGTATISLPQDVQAHAYDYPSHFFDRRVWRIERPLPLTQRVGEVVELLKRARRPMIIAGGGVHYAEANRELLDFAEAFGIPVSETFAGKGAMDAASDLAVGGQGLEGTAAANAISREADLVIAVGTRLTDFITGSNTAFQHPQVRFVAVNVNAADAYKNGAVPLVADAREALLALKQAAAKADVRPRPDYVAAVREKLTRWREVVRTDALAKHPGEAMSQAALIHTMNNAAREGDTIIAAAGGPPGDLLKIWDTRGGRHCHIEFGFSCMGYEIPAGLGVRLARPEGEVVVFIGDGTYLMNPTELVTAFREGLKVTVVIADNRGYQVIRRLQMWRTGRSFGNELRHRDPATNRLEGEYVQVDFAQNARSMGARTWHVRTPDELKSALAASRNEQGPCVIVAEVEKHRYLPASECWWDVAPAEVSEADVTRELRSEYETVRATKQRFYY